MHYDETDYGSIAKCKFCGTEYHIDKLGRVEEYKVKIKILGKVVEFYIESFSLNPEYIEYSFLGSNESFRERKGIRIGLEMEGYLYE